MRESYLHSLLWIFLVHLLRYSCFWTFVLFVNLNSQICQQITSENEGLSMEMERKCNLPHLNTAPKDMCSQSVVWSEHQGWDLSRSKIRKAQSGIHGLQRGAEPPREYKYMWRLLLCGGHIWLDFNWRAASQSLFALTSAQMAYAFLTHDIHTLWILREMDVVSEGISLNQLQ